MQIGLNISLTGGGGIAGSSPRIVVTPTSFNEEAAAGDQLATLSVYDPRQTIRFNTLSFDEGAAPSEILATMETDVAWVYTILDGAGGQFDIVGDKLIRGATALSHDLRPYPTIKIQASNGVRTITKTVKVTVNKTLPALPMPVGTKVMGFGHSFVARSGYAYGSSPSGESYGRLDVSTAGWFGDFASLRSLDRRWNMDVWYDRNSPNAITAPNTTQWAGAFFGVGGFKCADLIAGLDYVVARQPGVIILDVITNDVNSKIGPLSTLKSLYMQILNRLRFEGIRVIAMCPSIRTDWAIGDPRHQLLTDFANWMTTLNYPGLTIFDDRTELAALASSGVKVLEDGVHLTVPAHWVRTQKLLPILQGMITAGNFRAPDIAVGNLTPFSAGLSGTTGGKTNVTGSVATGLNAERNGGTDLIVASVANNEQTFTISPAIPANGLSGGEIRCKWTDLMFAANGIVPGDWIEGGYTVTLSAGKDWFTANMQFEFNGGTYYISGSGLTTRLSASNPGLTLTAPLTMLVTVPPMQVIAPPLILAPATYIRTSLRPVNVGWKADPTQSGALTVKIKDIWIRKVADPRPAWNL